MLCDSHLFDTSEYKPDHSLYSVTNKKVLGKMKDEVHGNVVHEFVGLKSKMYSIIHDEEEEGEVNEETDEEKPKKKVKVEMKRAKGIQNSVVKNHTRHEHYKQCFLERKSTCQR